MGKLTDYNEIRALLARHSFHFSKALGQNFLCAAWVPEEIADAAELDRETGVLEIGPGIGCLTAELSARAGRVVAIEADRRLLPVLAETLEGRENVEIVCGDALRQDLAALAAEKLAGLRPVVCANLPYSVTSPLLTAMLEARCFETMTVMIQKEVAQRICAGPGSAAYGAFSVFVQWHAVPRICFDVPPGCFIPQPKVTSSVLQLQRRKAPPVPVQDEGMLFRVVRAAFGQRRKTLSNALCGGGFAKPDVTAALEAAGIDPGVRGERLGLPEFARLADAFTVLTRDGGAPVK